MPQPGQHIFSGKLDQNQRGLVLRSDDGQVFSLPDVHGLERLLGDYVRIVGVVNDADMINPFRIERDEHHQG
jgi:hypothetical protein